MNILSEMKRTHIEQHSNMKRKQVYLEIKIGTVLFCVAYCYDESVELNEEKKTKQDRNMLLKYNKIIE